ncbi:S9 family peptidase [Planctomonas psychrotolerans]|uniref:S9 family peptidase n=1 Tax=Planctomonas psychrotolerans TaxID=2528712 RepID=UPI00123C419E|nr:S9 family peptidase [Planctomonas psychrotolerans]
MRASDIRLLTTLSRPSLSPDGGSVVVAATRADLDADAYVGQLWIGPTDASAAPRRFTRGFRDTAPQFSPDGTLVAFLRAEADAAPQLHVVDARGGEPVRVTDEKLGVTEFAWAPDGGHLALTSRVPEPGRYGTIPEVGGDAEPPRRITTQRYSANGVGYVVDRRSSVFLVATPDVSAEPAVKRVPERVGEKAGDRTALGVTPATRLTTDDADYSRPTFGPDGSHVLAVAARHDSRDTDLRTGVHEIALDGGEVRTIVGPEHDLAIADVVVAPDGTMHLLAQEVGTSGRDFVARNTALYRANADGSVDRRTDPESVDLGEVGSAITLESDGSVLVQNRVRGTVQLLRVRADDTIESVVDGAVEVTGAAAASGVTAVTMTDARGAGDLAVVRDGVLTRLTDFSAAVRDAGVSEPRELTVTGRDGYPVHGWLFTPAAEGPHPVLLVIHGGPFAAYSVGLFDEAQVYADAGYAVVLCNPRGSAGYGQAHGRVIRQRMGTVDLFDVLDFLDGALADPLLDSDRVGIMGGSYGGYLTAWTIAHDHRFAAAIVERGFLDPDGFVGTSDIGSFFGDEYVGTDPELMRAQSPQAVVDRVRTPALVLHSANDLRCPLPQAERYYAALKRGGAEAELVIFPGENHELSRSGRPRHRVQRFEVILEWWSRYLPVGGGGSAEDADAPDVGIRDLAF